MSLLTNDSELLTQYRFKKSEASFQCLVERYQGMVVGTAFRRTGNLETASDVAQRVFAVLARKAGLLIGRASIAGWLYQAAQYESMRAAQAEARAHARLVPFADEMIYTVPDRATLQTPERWAELEEAIDSLGETDREVLVLHYFQDLSYEEMSRSLGLQEPAVRKRVSRALERLGEVLRARGMAGNASLLLAGAVAIQVTLAPPAGLAHAALATAAAGGGVSALLTLTALLSSTSLKTIAVFAALASLPLLWFATTDSEPEPLGAVPTLSSASVPSLVSAGPGESNSAAVAVPSPVRSESPQFDAVASADAKGSATFSSFAAPAPVAVRAAPAVTRQPPTVAPIRIPRPMPVVTIPPLMMKAPAVEPVSVTPQVRVLEPATLITTVGGNQIVDVAAGLPDLVGAELEAINAAISLGNVLDELLVLNPLERIALSDFLNKELGRLRTLPVSVPRVQNLAQTVLQTQGESAVTGIVQGIQEIVPAAASTPEVIQAVASIATPVIAKTLAPAASLAGSSAGASGSAAALTHVTETASSIPKVLSSTTSAIPLPRLRR